MDDDHGAGASLGIGPSGKVGRFKFLQLIGEGGFGMVHVAEQERPVRRRVAFKILKAGVDTRQVLARFEAERQALAPMDHPNIAKVLDAGKTQSGRPDFAMELVRGKAWELVYSTTSRPFPKPTSGKIAVKVVNHYGDEVMQVYAV